MTRYQEQIAKLKKELTAHALAVHKTFWIVSTAVVGLWIVVFVVPVAPMARNSPPPAAPRMIAAGGKIPGGMLQCPFGYAVYADEMIGCAISQRGALRLVNGRFVTISKDR